MESHPETGTYPQEHGERAGVFIVATGWAIGLASRPSDLTRRKTYVIILHVI
jgi:hypothetical protein